MKLRFSAWQPLLLVLFYSWGSDAFALNSGSAQPLADTQGIGLLNMQEVINTVEEAKLARDALENEIKAKQAEFLKQDKELAKEQQDLENQASLLSEEAKLRKQKDLQEKYINLQRAKMSFENEIKQKEAQATQKIAMQAAKIAEDLAQKKKLVEVRETGSSGIIYIANPVDLTQEVIALYNSSPKNTSSNKASSEPKKVSQK